MGKRKSKSLLNDQNTYTYTPLLSPTTSIRLLRLLPSQDRSFPLRCILFPVELSTPPPYIAVSYTWGDATHTSSIAVSSSSTSTFPTQTSISQTQTQTGCLSITHNLKHFLQRLRRLAEEIVIWVDALCINQADISERSIQTTRMRDVYLHAQSVAVWLGNADGNSLAAIKIVRELHLCPNLSAVQNLVGDASKREAIEALVGLFRRQYWWRVWVIQEIACAAQATAYVGDECITWTELDGVCSVLQEVESELHKVFYNRPSWVRTLTHGGPRGLQLSRYNSEIKAPPLLEALLTHKSKKATDPRDKVFALLGISASRDTFGAVDYARGVSEIYVHTARHIISTTRKLDVICVKQHDSVRVSGLPTWVPDWTRPVFGAGTTVLGLHHRTPAFSAAGDTDADVEFVDGEDGLVLRAKGVVLGRMTAAGRPYKKRGAPSYIGPSIESFNSWWSLFISTLPGPPSEADQVRIAHLISCGTWTSQPEHEIISKMHAIFALSASRSSPPQLTSLDSFSQSTSSTSTEPTQLDHSSRTSTTSTIASQNNEEDELEDEMSYMLSSDDKERLSAMIAAGMMMNRRRLFISNNGIMGLAPWNAEVGDVVVVLFGCKFPVVLKECSEGRFELRGEAYVETFMEGEAIPKLEHGGLRVQTFEIG